MTEQLTLSRNAAQATSTWEGTRVPGGTVIISYTAPSTDYDNITIYVPDSMAGAAFQSVSFTFTGAGAAGTKSIKFSDTREDVTNARLLARLQAGEREIRLLFTFRAAGYSGGIGSHSSTCYWQNLSAAVEYIPASQVSGNVDVGGIHLFYAFKQSNIAEGEPFDVIFSFLPAKQATKIDMQIRPSGASGSTVKTIAWDINAEAGTQATLTLSGIMQGLTYPARVKTAVVRFRITAGGTVYVSSYISIPLKLIRERLAPSVTVLWDDASAAFRKIGAFVQGKSAPVAALSVALDTEADDQITAAGRTLIIGGQAYDMGGDTQQIASDYLSGSEPYTVTVTDSHGLTGAATGWLEVLPYSAPYFSALNMQRYTEKTSPSGETYYVPSDDGAHIWVDASGAVAELNSRNGWTLSAAVDSAAPEVLAFGADGRALEYLHDRELFTRTLDPAAVHEIVITLSDAFETVAYSLTIPKSGGIFSIERGGVAIGKRATGTEDAPTFECAFPAVFEAGASDGDGLPLGADNFTLAETHIGSYLGKPLYRKGIQLAQYPTSATEVDIGASPAHIVRIYGFIASDRGDTPLNWFRNGYPAETAICRSTAGRSKLLCYTGLANTGAVIWIEFTKEALW